MTKLKSTQLSNSIDEAMAELPVVQDAIIKVLDAINRMPLEGFTKLIKVAHQKAGNPKAQEWVDLLKLRKIALLLHKAGKDYSKAVRESDEAHEKKGKKR